MTPRMRAIRDLISLRENDAVAIKFTSIWIKANTHAHTIKVALRQVLNGSCGLRNEKRLFVEVMLTERRH